MLDCHKLVRNALRKCTRTAYDNILKEAKLLPIEEQCVNLFIIDNRTQIEIAARTNLSERSVRLYLQRAYEKIYGCRLIAEPQTDANDNPCYAMDIGGVDNVWNDESADAVFSANDTTNSPAAIYGTMALCRKLSGNADAAYTS